MGMRIVFLTLLATFAFFSQVSTSYVKQEAVEMRALVRQVQADRIILQTMQTDEQVRRRLAEVERWAAALDGLAPPAPEQIQPSLRHALSPGPLPRPTGPRLTGPRPTGPHSATPGLAESQVSLEVGAREEALAL